MKIHLSPTFGFMWEWARFYIKGGLCILHQNQTSKAMPLPLPTIQPTAAGMAGCHLREEEEKERDRDTHTHCEWRVVKNRIVPCPCLHSQCLFEVESRHRISSHHLQKRNRPILGYCFWTELELLTRGLLQAELNWSNIWCERICRYPSPLK